MSSRAKSRDLKYMSKDKEILDSIADKEYEHGFVTDVEQEFIPKGLNEDIIRLISAKKEEPEWMLEFRLEAFRRWQKMTLPTWVFTSFDVSWPIKRTLAVASLSLWIAIFRVLVCVANVVKRMKG